MGAVELRNTLKDYINEADERLLNLLKAVVESYMANDIVASSVDGRPLNKKQYSQELIDAEAEIGRGEFTAQEDLENESENW